MSLWARLVIAAGAILLGAMMFLHGTTADSDKSWFSYVFGAFCLFIAAASLLRGRVAQFCGSVVGTGVFVAGVVYLGHELRFGQAVSGSRGEPSIVNACLFLLVFGLPGILYAVQARFGSRRAVSRDDT